MESVWMNWRATESKKQKNERTPTMAETEKENWRNQKAVTTQSKYTQNAEWAEEEQ